MPATAARRSRRRSPSSSTRWTTRRRSRWAIPRRSSWRRAMPPCCRATSTTPSTATPAPRPSTRALKIALAYHRARGQGTRTRFVGRERGYHGVGFGGISVGGMVNNRKWFGAMLPGVDHLPHTHLREERLLQGPARAWRGAGRRAGAHRRPARRLQHRRRHRRALRRLDRLPAAAQGLPRAPAPDLRQARHPADLRRGHHRLRPPRHRLRRRQVRRHSRPDDGRQGHQQRHGADGRRVRAQAPCSTA